MAVLKYKNKVTGKWERMPLSQTKDSQKAQIIFEVLTTNINISLTGNGIVTVDYGDGISESMNIDSEYTFKHRYSDETVAHTVYVNGLEHITEFDAHSCGIESITFGKLEMLNKLVVYDNNISDLDISSMPNLQYLHIFNNPICDSDDKLTALFARLPDRNNKAFGSIIMYPFYPLGVLVYKNGNTLTKYPSGKAYTATEGEYYRDMNAETVTWYKYEDGAFIEQAEQNALINRRVKMEDITLPLGWLFGSAIQYDEEEYAKCGFHFKQNHVQDYWETAEHGLGVTMGVYDFIAGKVAEFDNMNIKAYINVDGTDSKGRDADSEATVYTHGDAIVSSIACRGEGIYGIAPDCNMYLVDAGESTYGSSTGVAETYKQAYLNGSSYVTQNSDIVSMSFFPFNYGGEAAEAEKDALSETTEIWDTFASRHPLFGSIGNFGDGKPWTDEEAINNWDIRFGSNAYKVAALRDDNTIAVFSVSTREGEYTDIYSQYGNGILLYNSYYGEYEAKSGTSFASPLCAAVVLLMMCVYKKLYGEQESYSKGSAFMEWVTVHTNPLYREMNKVVGKGKPDLMYYNRMIADGLSKTVTDVAVADMVATIGNGTPVDVIVEPADTDNARLTYDYDLAKLAIVKNKVYPLLTDGGIFPVTAYSNRNEDVSTTFNVTVPKEVFSVNKISDTTIPTRIYDKENISILGDSKIKDYTVQMLIHFADDDGVDKAVKVFDFITDDGYNAYLNIGYKKDESAQLLTFIIKSKRYKGEWLSIYNKQFAKGVAFESFEDNDFVITFTVSNGYYKTYMNGNLIGSGKLVTELPLSNWLINSGVLLNHSKDDVLVYGRELSAEEIIQNTVALLNDRRVAHGSEIIIKTSSENIAVSLKGTGIITVDYGDGESESVSIDGEYTFNHRYCGVAATHTVTINGAEHVNELDMHGCGINNILFGKLDALNKLVIYDNNISEMDISGMPNLQYLHIFNNPICNSDDSLAVLFKQLPDRTNKAFGSIIMYPFYPLGVLVSIDKTSKQWTKYPNGGAVTRVEGQYYRDMNAVDENSNKIVKWYKYEGNKLKNQAAQNALINRRIRMEDITIPLGWLFGSAIQYDEEEYAKCGYHFKQNHVQDYWETAERGEGQTIGLYDHIAGKIPGFSELNIKAFEALDGTSLPIAGHINNQIHGDFLLSLIANRGNLVYGIAPDSCQYLVDSYENATDEYDQNSEVNFQKCAERLTANSDIITASAFYPASATYLPAKSYFHPFATVNPLFASISNDGDGLEWTEEERTLMDTDAYFGENVFLVGSINEDDTFSPFSNSSYPTSANSKTNFTHEDIFAQYGSNIMAVTNAFGGMIYSACGTSCSSPICAAIVALMKNVYIKLYGVAESYGKNSDFMRFVKAHSNPIYRVMNRAVGNGKPDLMYFNPLLANGTTVNVENVEIAEVNAIHGRGIDISPIVTPSNADNLAVTYDYNMSKFAIMGSVLHPLIEQEDTVAVTAYSNMNEDKAATFNVNVPTASTKTYEIDKKRISLEDAAMSNSTKFTLQARINFPNIDSAKEENIFTFEHDDILVYLRNSFGKTMPTQKMRIMAEESVSNTDNTNLVMDDRLIGGIRMENIEGKVCVITLAVDDKDYSFYINGNLLRTGTLVTDIPLCGLTINNDYLLNGNAEDVRIYEEILLHEEVIQNTIALLNGNERYSDIEKALDEIIKFQESLIGGDSE